MKQGCARALTPVRTILLILSLLCSFAQAEVLDQSAPIGIVGFNGDLSILDWQQEVVAGIPGVLSRFQLYVNGPGSVMLYVNRGALWQGDAHDFQTTVSLGTGWQSIDTSAAGISLAAGERFVIGLKGVDGGLGFNGGDGTYAAGTLFLNGVPYTASSYDIAFRTYMNPSSAATLTVVSAHGGASPGSQTAAYGTLLNQYVTNSPVVSGTTRYVCNGGTVAGNAATTVNATHIALTLTNDATLTWKWDTQHAFSRASSGHGTVAGDASGWYAQGSTVTVTAVPDAHYHFAGWTGDVQGDTNALAMTVTLDQARAITANFAIDRHTLTVVSPHDTPTPAVGAHTYDWGTALNPSVTSPFTVGATQYVCRGWTMTGHEPASGVATQFAMTVTNDAVLTWLWTTNYAIDASSDAHGSTIPAGRVWVPRGANQEIEFTWDEFWLPLNTRVDGVWIGQLPRFTFVNVTASHTIHVQIGADTTHTHYVATNGGSVWPYVSWATAATNVQDAVTVAMSGDLVLVTNGVYAATGAVSVVRGITVRSVNGPGATTVDGGGTHRCFALNHAGIVLGGLTLRNGYSAGHGGALYAALPAVVTNTLIVGSTAGGSGGGLYLAAGGLVRQCLVHGNAAGAGGGGAALNGGLLESATIAGNTGGGLMTLGNARVLNSVVYGNGGSEWTDAGGGASYEHTCTTPLAGLPGGAGCIDGDPWYVEPGVANYRLHIYSPCVNRGTNQAWMAGTVDPDTKPRIVAGVVDMGYFESGSVPHAGPSQVHYASTNGYWIWPYTNWHMAARCLQDAVDATTPGNTVIANDGAYDIGGRSGSICSNRVVITNSILVVSSNGPAVTSIVGAGPVGDAAVRCVKITDGSTLSGFTLTNGHTRTTGSKTVEQSGGGVWATEGAVITNCWLKGNKAPQYGGGSFDGLLHDCLYEGNRVGQYGGGAYGGRLYRCVVSNNTSLYHGGGTAFAALYDCTVVTNVALDRGGGMYGGAATNSTLRGNRISGTGTTSGGGGAAWAGLHHCTVVDNHGGAYGGGTYQGNMADCLVFSNTAWNYGGGSYKTGMTNCTVTGNSAWLGGGSYYGMIYNSTLSGNAATQGGGGCNANVFGSRVWGNSAAYGGGLYNGAAWNSSISNNTAARDGGGMCAGTLFSCLVVGNTASNGGGASGSTLTNCTVAFNTALANGGGTYWSYQLNSVISDNTPDNVYSGLTFHTVAPGSGEGGMSMTAAEPVKGASGEGVITAAPRFVDPAKGDYRLAWGSAGIDAGLSVEGATNDLAGGRRVVDGDLDGVATIDMGAFEYDPGTTSSGRDGVPDAWKLARGYNPTNAADMTADDDRDGANNLAEYYADTDPTNRASVFRIEALLEEGGGRAVRFTTSPHRRYTLQYATGLLEGEWQPVAGEPGVSGTGGPSRLSDPSGTSSARYYRVQVDLP